MDNYLQYVGGVAGATAITSIAAASAYYYASRPTPDTPLVPLHNQGPVLEVSFIIYFIFYEFCYSLVNTLMVLFCFN